MNKKVFILPLAVAAMGLASCNSGGVSAIKRHEFKVSNKDTVLKIFEGLEDKQWNKDASEEYTTTKMQEKKVSINMYNENKLDEVIGFGTEYYLGSKVNYSNKSTFQIDWDQDNKTLLKLLKKEGTFFEEELTGTINRDYETGFKLDENKWKTFMHDNIVGDKYILDTGKPEEGDDFNTKCIEDLCYDDQTYVYIDPMGVMNNELMLDLTGEKIYKIFTNIDGHNPLDGFEAKKATITYGSNDDNSAMISIKGKLDIKDFVTAWRGDVTSEYTVDGNGDVDFDYYFAIENNFLSQCEFKVQYNNCKINIKRKDKNGGTGSLNFESVNGSSYTKLETNYKSDKTVKVDLGDYIDFEEE